MSEDTRIGIDVGGTILGFLTCEEGEEVLYENAAKIIGMIVKKYGAENVMIISKAGEDMRKRTLKVLHRTDFFRSTGFLEGNVIFCEEDIQKRNIIKRQKVNIFLDDKVYVMRKVIDLKVLERFLWFRIADRKKFDTKKIIDERITPIHRSKIRIINKWSKVWKHLLDIPRTRESKV